MDIKALEESVADDEEVLSLVGDLDAESAPDLRARISELLDRQRVRVVLDLDGVSFIDSTGLGALVGATRKLRGHGGDLILVCTRPRLLRIFDITSLSDTLRIEASIDDAQQRGDSDQTASRAVIMDAPPHGFPEMVQSVSLADHAMGIELQIEELVDQRRRAEVQGRGDDVADLTRAVTELQEELALTAERAGVDAT